MTFNRVTDFLASVIETGEKQSGIEYRVQHKDDSLRWHTSNASCLKGPDGNVEWFLGIARDVTETKRAQRELEDAMRELRSTQAQLAQTRRCPRQEVFRGSPGRGRDACRCFDGHAIAVASAIGLYVASSPCLIVPSPVTL